MKMMKLLQTCMLISFFIVVSAIDEDRKVIMGSSPYSQAKSCISRQQGRGISWVFQQQLSEVPSVRATRSLESLTAAYGRNHRASTMKDSDQFQRSGKGSVGVAQISLAIGNFKLK
ncbi:hypothetical protein L2E82_13545 [Cichorium intybus]|uniref:Uncharacterized protein n=1 Tax=Cichorium intybus TaxID=13427 RepID=A0ACB9EY84_CICIN|nr:hypothetical protein L2E82_13545 [Cichorium intybus]